MLSYFTLYDSEYSILQTNIRASTLVPQLLRCQVTLAENAGNSQFQLSGQTGKTPAHTQILHISASKLLCRSPCLLPLFTFQLLREEARIHHIPLSYFAEETVHVAGRLSQSTFRLLMRKTTCSYHSTIQLLQRETSVPTSMPTWTLATHTATNIASFDWENRQRAAPSCVTQPSTK